MPAGCRPPPRNSIHGSGPAGHRQLTRRVPSQTRPGSMTRLYAAMLRLDDRACVVVGGGRVAVRKVCGLLEAGATVRVIAPDIAPTLVELIEAGRVTWVRRKYRRGDLSGATL